MRRLLLTAGLLAAVACGFSFANPTLIASQRILGIASDEPQLTVGSTQNFNVSALIADPTTMNPVSYQVRLCLVPAGSDGVSVGSGSRSGRGGLGASAAAEIFGGGNQETLSNVSSVNRCPDDAPVVASDSQPLGTVANEVEIPAAIISALGIPMGAVDAGMTSDGGAPSDGGFMITDGGFMQRDGGVPMGSALAGAVFLQIDLRVTNDDGGTQFAVKDIPITPTLPPGDMANQNPVMAEIAFDGKPWPDGGTLQIPFAACSMPTSSGGRFGGGKSSGATCQHQLVPLFDPLQSEQFHLPDPDGGWDVHRERLSFSWFTDEGSIDRNTTSQGTAGEISDGGDLLSNWSEPASSTSVNFWIVVRDGRGGESWLQRRLVFQ